MLAVRNCFSRSLEAFSLLPFNLSLPPRFKAITDVVTNLFSKKKEAPATASPITASKSPPTPRIQQAVTPIFQPERIAILGAGAFGVVSKVQGVAPNTFDALKELIRQPSNQETVKAEQELHNEVRLLNKIHENTTIPGVQLPPYRIVKLEPTTLHPPQRTIGYTTTGVGYLAPLYTGGSLSQCTDYTAEMPRQLIAGLKILHLKGIVHGDITPENIFVMNGEKRRYDLADFGQARILDDMRPEFDRLRSTHNPVDAAKELRGPYTSIYLTEADKAAEAAAIEKNDFEAWKHAREQADLFALGCTLIQRLAPESLPFWGVSEEDQAAFIRGCARIGLSLSERALILRLADQDPANRTL